MNSINGISNQRFGGVTQGVADPAVFRVLQLLRRLQLSGALSFRIREGKNKDTTQLVLFRTEHLSEEDLVNLRETQQLLGFHPDEREFRLVFAPTASLDREIAAQTRSLYQILTEVGRQADVPDIYISEGRATPGFAEKTGDQQFPGEI